MNVALWIVAGVLAVVFLGSSISKLVLPKEKLAGTLGNLSKWAEDFRPGALKAIGAVEFPGAVGLILPAVLNIAPVLVPVAACGAVLLFAGAVITRSDLGRIVAVFRIPQAAGIAGLRDS